MRVQLYYSAGPATSGGAHTYFEDIFRAFLGCAAEASHEFVILGYDERPGIDLPPNVEWVTLRRSWSRRAVERGIYEADVRYRRWVHGTNGRERPHQRYLREEAHALGIQMTLSWVPGADLYYLPAVTTVWDLGHRVHPYFPELAANGEWERREGMYRRLPQAARVITSTESCKEQIVRFYQVAPDCVVVIPFPTPGFALDDAGKNGKPVACRFAQTLPPGFLFYPAQFWPHKNHVGLLHALRLLKEQTGSCPPLALCGADKGNLAHVRSTAVQLGLADDVHCLGFVSRAELVWLYRHALALVFVTFLGPDNLPPLEAFALGCPVVASNVEGAREQLGDAALIVDPASASDIARGIEHVWRDPAARQALIGKGRRRAGQFTGRDYVRAVFGLLDELEPLFRCCP
jgi:glycosyltransferase involved in cell wall biosynthesis